MKGIAFTDSVHSNLNECPIRLRQRLRNIIVNWSKSKLRLDAPVRKIGKNDNGVVNVSAGHEKHEFTSGTAFPSIFPFFDLMSKGKNTYLRK